MHDTNLTIIAVIIQINPSSTIDFYNEDNTNAAPTKPKNKGYIINHAQYMWSIGNLPFHTLPVIYPKNKLPIYFKLGKAIYSPTNTIIIAYPKI